MANDIKPIDYVAQAISRVIQQYADKPNFLAVVELYAGIAQRLETSREDLYNLSDIDKMGGHNLDVIGDIVGQSRVLIDAEFLEYFGYIGAPGAGAYGDINNPYVGSRYRSIEEPTTGNVIMADPEYRLLIRARISKNFTTCTHEEILAQILFLFSIDKSYLFERVMVLDIAVGRTLTNTELYMITEYDLLPRPSGVRIGNILEFDGTVGAFGYDGSGVLGYGDVNNPNVGGKYASIVKSDKKGSSFDSSFNAAFG